MSENVRTCPKCGYERCRLDNNNVWFCLCGHEWSDEPDPRDALIAALRSELAACHKVIIDAMAELNDGSPSSIIMDILDSAPEPSDETLAMIEETDTGGDDVQAR